MRDPFLMVVLIVAIVMFANVMRARYGHRRRRVVALVPAAAAVPVAGAEHARHHDDRHDHDHHFELVHLPFLLAAPPGLN